MELDGFVGSIGITDKDFKPLLNDPIQAPSNLEIQAGNTPGTAYEDFLHRFERVRVNVSA